MRQARKGKKMMIAKIRPTKANHTIKGSKVIFHTLCRDIEAPRKKIVSVNGEWYVPAKIFADAGANACQLIDGFIEGIIVKEI